MAGGIAVYSGDCEHHLRGANARGCRLSFPFGCNRWWAIGAATGVGIPFLNCFLFADEPVSTISAAGSSSTPHHPVRLSFSGSWLDFVGRF